jgi:hypothetical protein
MATAKKQETSAAPAAGGAKKSTGAKAKAPAKGAAKGAANKPAPAGSPGVPLIDTSLAASAAAKMVLNRAVGGAGAPVASGDAEAAGDKRETSTFKQLKQGLSKGGSQGIGGLLGGVQGGKKVTQTFAGPNQVRRNQTFGADASRTNIPRRTGG